MCNVNVILWLSSSTTPSALRSDPTWAPTLGLKPKKKTWETLYMFLNSKFIQMSNVLREQTKAKFANQKQIKILFGGASVCSVFLCNLQHVPNQFVSSAAGWDVLDLVTHLMWTHGLIYTGVAVSVWKGDSQRRCQETCSTDSGLVDVTLTENRGGHVGVSMEPDIPNSSAPPPPSLLSQSSFSSSSVLSQSCFVHLIH